MGLREGNAYGPQSPGAGQSIPRNFVTFPGRGGPPECWVGRRIAGLQRAQLPAPSSALPVTSFFLLVASCQRCWMLAARSEEQKEHQSGAPLQTVSVGSPAHGRAGGGECHPAGRALSVSRRPHFSPASPAQAPRQVDQASLSPAVPRAPPQGFQGTDLLRAGTPMRPWASLLSQLV